MADKMEMGNELEDPEEGMLPREISNRGIGGMGNRRWDPTGQYPLQAQVGRDKLLGHKGTCPSKTRGILQGRACYGPGVVMVIVERPLWV